MTSRPFSLRLILPLLLLSLLVMPACAEDSADATTAATGNSADRVVYSIDLSTLGAENAQGDGWLYDAAAKALYLHNEGWDYTLTGGEGQRLGVQITADIKNLMLIDATLHAPDGSAETASSGGIALTYAGSEPVPILLVGNSQIIGGSGVTLEGMPGGAGGAGIQGAFSIVGDGSLAVRGGDGGDRPLGTSIPAGKGASAVEGYLTVFSGAIALVGGSSSSTDMASGSGVEGQLVMYGGSLIARGGDGKGTARGCIGGAGVQGPVVVMGGVLTAQGGNGCTESGRGGNGITALGGMQVYGGIVEVTGGNGRQAGDGITLLPEGSILAHQGGNLTYAPGQGSIVSGQGLTPADAYQGN